MALSTTVLALTTAGSLVFTAGWGIERAIQPRAEGAALEAPARPAGPAPTLSALPSKPVSKLTAASGPQVLSLSGTHLASVSAVTISRPDGLIVTWGDDVVVSTAPGAVTIKPTLDVPGTYMVTVRTESGASNPLMLDVKK